ncbi:MAG: hypothetical protein AAF290_16675 [Pseudomonadota bacterium]
MRSSTSLTLFSCSLVLLLVGCSATTQTTSGRDYLSKYDRVPAASTERAGSINDAIRDAAAVEPVLRFPARIGLARIDGHGRLSPIPEAEAVHWLELLEDLGNDFGEFVPVDLLVADMTKTAVSAETYRHMGPVDRVRLAAARQHLDAVMLYQVTTVDEYRKNALASVDFTLISAFLLPSRKVKSEALGAALLIDVVQGYPYGSIQTRADGEKLATVYGASNRADKLHDQLRVDVTAQLVEEAEPMFNRLYRQLHRLPATPAPRQAFVD